ncbi:MAG: hypothetical protein JEZ09_05125 [Salinivirgaceae bacterium]|nr:hypothetical protein [Salinivirgaceae bacterium]
MFSTFDRIYTFSINTIAFIVAVVITALFWVGATHLFSNISIYIPITIFGGLLGVLIGAYLYVILSIPFQLSKKFDVIKNKVALHGYESVDEFQKEIAAFIIKMFKYPGVSIDGGVFRFKGAEILTYNIDFDLEKLNSLSENKPIIRLNGGKAFYIPIGIGSKDLGHMILISNDFVLPIMHSILLDFESYMLDDQLLHVQYLTNK